MRGTAKTYGTLLLSALVGTSLAFGGHLAVAADKSAKDAERPTDTRTTERDARQAEQRKADVQPHPGGLVEASWLIGTRIHDHQGKELGKIEHLWLDPKDGRVKDVIVSVGATLGVGGKDKVVSWNDVKLAWKDQKLFVSVDPNALRDAYQVKMDREDRGPAASPRTAPSTR
jgi:sporulation protein YlmC with PRC-barrel domain